MLEAGLAVFRKMLERYGDQVILDEYLPKDGTYLFVELEEDGYREIKRMNIQYDKKEKVVLGMEEGEWYRFLCCLDYYSKLIDMNKPVDAKKQIHSNQYLAFAVKKEVLKGKKLTEEAMKGYYERLAFPDNRYQKKQDQFLYQTVKEKLGDPDRETIGRIKSYVTDGKLWDGVDLGRKDYLKIFFVYPDWEQTKRIYKRENERYLIPCIYNSNDFNKWGELGQVMGLPNNNMGMNAKKPYLANRSRKTTVPILMGKEDVLLQNKMFDYWMALASQGKVHLYIDTNEEEPLMRAYLPQEEPKQMVGGYYVHLRKGKELEIQHWDAVTDYYEMMEHPFYLREVMPIPDKYKEKTKLPYQMPCRRLFDMKPCFDIILFGGKLFQNLFMKEQDISITDVVIKRCLLECRDRVVSWFYCGDEEGAKRILKKITMELIFHSMARGEVLQARNQFNLLISLMDHWNQNRRWEEFMENIRNQLRIYLNADGDWNLESEEEFAYALGQAAMFFLSRSRASKLPSHAINGLINVKTHNMAKEKLMKLFNKYNYDIDLLRSKRVRTLMAHIMLFKPKGELNQKMILAGMMDDLLLYEKQEKKGDKDEGEGEK